MNKTLSITCLTVNNNATTTTTSQHSRPPVSKSSPTVRRTTDSRQDPPPPTSRPTPSSGRSLRPSDATQHSIDPTSTAQDRGRLSSTFHLELVHQSLVTSSSLRCPFASQHRPILGPVRGKNLTFQAIFALLFVPTRLIRRSTSVLSKQETQIETSLGVATIFAALGWLGFGGSSLS